MFKTILTFAMASVVSAQYGSEFDSFLDEYAKEIEEAKL